MRLASATARQVKKAQGAAARLATLLLGAALVAGCAGERPVFLPPDPPRQPAALQGSAAGTATQREHQRLMQAFGGEYRAPAAKRAVDEIVAKLAAASGSASYNYEVTLLNSPVVNAFALPTGRLYLTRGLLALANDRAEIASVIAHEIAHVQARHGAERAELQQRSELVQRVVSQVLEDPVAGALVQARSKLSLASFSRQQELEADMIAVKAIAAAGYDPYGASRFLASLGRTTRDRAMLMGERPGSRGMDILSTHPSTTERIQLTLATARQIAAPGLGQRDRDNWLTALDGLSFGDDPREGAVRGRRYVNPSLGLSFTAPEGLTLESTRDAVLGVGGNGARAMRFDSVQLDSSQTLESYVGTGWIDGVTPGRVETSTINGLPAALTSGKGTDWSFRLAAIRSDQRTYRFIFAAKGPEADLDRNFRAVVSSFTRLSAAEAAQVRPLRIRTVVASGSDTPATLASRMAPDERALDQFLILNGLDRGAALTPGQRYKLIVE
ncbi:MAG: M48 family metalloprotease [Bosea sp.]|jgi:predicted Zn-dependent protease|nr:M48 family metalloprotease [Bosea sp. (in: a-proteobacteria)]